MLRSKSTSIAFSGSTWPGQSSIYDVGPEIGVYSHSYVSYSEQLGQQGEREHQQGI